jgi:hypothetical protein
MVGTTTTHSSHEHHENHELQALSEAQLGMVPQSNREYQTVANLDWEEEPLVTSDDDMSDLPAKGIY